MGLEDGEIHRVQMDRGETVRLLDHKLCIVKMGHCHLTKHLYFLDSNHEFHIYALANAQKSVNFVRKGQILCVSQS